jgi:hypothetical protein
MAAGAAIAEDILFRGDFEFLKFENNLHMSHLLSGLFTFENLYWREAKRDAGRNIERVNGSGFSMRSRQCTSACVCRRGRAIEAATGFIAAGDCFARRLQHPNLPLIQIPSSPRIQP